jgi:hypothetical protein
VKVFPGIHNRLPNIGVGREVHDRIDALHHLSQLLAIRNVSEDQLEALSQKTVTGREVVINDDLISLPPQQPRGVTTDVACSANN